MADLRTVLLPVFLTVQLQAMAAHVHLCEKVVRLRPSPKE